MDEFARDAVIVEHHSVEFQQIVDLGQEIETTMDWYDHIAFAFLAYPEPLLALQKMKAVVENRKSQNQWSNLIVTPFIEHCQVQLRKTEDSQPNNKDMSKLIVEILHLLKQTKLLSNLDVYSDDIPILNVDPLRYKFFKLIDQLDGVQVQQLIETINRRVKTQGETNYPCVEMHLLEWMVNQNLSLQNLWDLAQSAMGGSSPLVSSPTSGVYPPQNSDIFLSTNYDLKTFSITKGLCIIINQMNFFIDRNLPREVLQLVKKDLSYRFGSDLDRDNLSATFRMLGNHVKVYENQSWKQLHETFDKISKNTDFTLYDGLIVCILSHGEEKCIMSTDSIPVTLDSIKSHFDGVNCCNLIGKPKLFFIQACQGINRQIPVPEKDEYQHDGILRTSPAISNYFEAWATIPGYQSYRSVNQGSVFVRKLCQILKKYGHLRTLNELMTMVNQQVSQWQTQGTTCMKQMSTISSSLTGEVRLQRDKDSFVEGYLDFYENNLFENVVKQAVSQFISCDPSGHFLLISRWSTS